jgi:hypothetical protein
MVDENYIIYLLKALCKLDFFFLLKATILSDEKTKPLCTEFSFDQL